MRDRLFFTPGPSQLFPTVEGHLETALAEGLASISHRSGAFKEIYADSVAGLRKILNLPPAYRIIFTGSASEIFFHIGRNLVEKQSFHFVNGSFSKRFREYVEQTGKTTFSQNQDGGKGFSLADPDLKGIENCDLIALTQNETSTGVAWPHEKLAEIRKRFPEKIIALDGVSSLPIPEVDFSQVNTALFSVQKAFGLPAGLGVWLVDENAVQRARKLDTADSRHFLKQVEYAEKNQTLATPNVLGIYLLGKVCEDLLEKGIGKVRAEAKQKREKLIDFAENHPRLSLFVEDQNWRSETVIVLETETSSAEVNRRLNDFNIEVGRGYGTWKDSHLRIANFPAHNPDQMDHLIRVLQQIL